MTYKTSGGANALGLTNDPAWDGVSEDASAVALLKAISAVAGGGGGGGVSSVNGDTGPAVTLSLASADFANQGTTTTVLHGNASGNPSFAAVSLSADVTGTLADGSLSSNVPLKNAANVFTTNQQITAAEPRLIFNESDQAADEKLWDLDFQTKVFSLRTRTDADGAGITALAAVRGTGTAVTGLTVFSGTLPTTPAKLTVFGNGATSDIQANSSNPSMQWYESDAGTDLKLWANDVNAGVWRLRTRTDADGAGRDFMTVTRGATVAITSIAWGDTTGNPTFTFLGTGAVAAGGTFAATSSVSGSKFTITGSDTTAPTLGTYRPGSSRLAFSTASARRGEFDANGNLITLQATADQSYSLQTPTTGFAITIANNITTLILKPAGTLATGTITMPATPIDGQNVRFTTSQIITALTVSPNSGQSIVGAPTTLAVGQGAAYIYSLSDTTWYRLYLGT